MKAGQIRPLRFECMESRRLLTCEIFFTGAPFQNPVNPCDVDASGDVAPVDALLIANALAANSWLPFSAALLQGIQPSAYLDVDGNDEVANEDFAAVAAALDDPNEEDPGSGDPNSGTISFSASNLSISEGTGIVPGTLYVNIEYTGSSPAGGTVSVSTRMSATAAHPANDGSPTSGFRDYWNHAESIGFSAAELMAGITTKTFYVDYRRDDIVEFQTETFEVVLEWINENGQSETLVVEASIEDDDSTLIWIEPADIPYQGKEGNGLLDGYDWFAIKLSNRVDVQFSVALSTIDGTATGGEDYEPWNQKRIEIAPLSSAEYFILPYIGDRKTEADETLTLKLVGKEWTSGPGTERTEVFIDPFQDAATGVIENDDSATLRLLHTSSTALEDSGMMEFEVKLVQPGELYAVASDADIIISYQTRDNTAFDQGILFGQNDFDGEPAGGQIVLPAGSSTVSIPVTLNPDQIVELDETFFLDITAINPNGRNIVLDSVTSATGTILHDDGTAQVRIFDAGSPEDNPNHAVSEINFLVSSDKLIDVPVSVNFVAVSGTATSIMTDLDYSVVTVGPTITLDPGSQIAGENIVVRVYGDWRNEPSIETFELKLLPNTLVAGGRPVTITKSIGQGEIFDSQDP